MALAVSITRWRLWKRSSPVPANQETTSNWIATNARKIWKFVRSVRSRQSAEYFVWPNNFAPRRHLLYRAMPRHPDRLCRTRISPLVSPPDSRPVSCRHCPKDHDRCKCAQIASYCPLQTPTCQLLITKTNNRSIICSNNRIKPPLEWQPINIAPRGLP